MPLEDPRLAALPTPALLVDEGRLERNAARLGERAAALGVTLRPHLKTLKSVELARRLVPGGGPATVSTLAEAEAFAAAGFCDLVYAVGIAPAKLERVAGIRSAGCDLVVLLDSVAQARAVVEASQRQGAALPALIEVDCDGHRGGLEPDDDELVAVGHVLAEGAELRGVLTHAGGSYGVVGPEAHAAFAEQERTAAVRAAERLRAAGLACPVVSVGSSPTAHAARDLSGVTEVRAGVYAFFDLVQAGLGVCAVDDVALSVLCTVIGHQRARGWTIVDAGWTALSQDRGTADQAVDQGYGLVCDARGEPLAGGDLLVVDVNQEHGVLALRSGSAATLPDLPVGTLLRVLPNHACAMAERFDRYHLVPGPTGAPLETLPRLRGW